MSDNEEFIFIPANQLKAGMFLDLEGDPFATMAPPDADEQLKQDSISASEMFKYEYAIVSEIEQEDEATTVVHCEQISFACPPYHQIKVATHSAQMEDGEIKENMSLDEFLDALEFTNTNITRDN